MGPVLVIALFIPAVVAWLWVFDQLLHGRRRGTIAPDRCLICGALARADPAGVYRCGTCGFDVEAARRRPRLFEALRDLREIRYELELMQTYYVNAKWSIREHPRALPRPYLGASATIIRDLVRDGPSLLRREEIEDPYRNPRGDGRPEAEDTADEYVVAVLHGLEGMLIGLATTPANAWDGEDREAQRRQALAQLADWRGTLVTLHRMLAVRLVADEVSADFAPSSNGGGRSFARRGRSGVLRRAGRSGR